MRRTLMIPAIFVFVLGVVGTSQAPAQPEEQPGDKLRQPGSDTATAEAGGSEDRDDETPAAHQRKQAVDGPGGTLAARLNQLHEAMTRELELTTEQEQAITQLFTDHLRQLTDDSGRQRADNAETMEKLRTLRTQMIDARKAGDDETAKKLRNQMIQEMDKWRPPPSEGGTQHLLEELTNKLDPGQQPKFRKLVKHYRLDRPDRPRGGAFRVLMRALRNPELGLSDEQRRASRDIVREALKGGTSRGSGRARMDEAAKLIRGRIMELLTPEQQAKFEALVGGTENAEAGTSPSPDSARKESLPREPEGARTNSPSAEVPGEDGN